MGYRDAEFETLPEGWDVSELQELVENHNTKREPLNSQERATRQGEYPYCGANGVVDHIDDYKFDGDFVLIAEDGGYWGKHEASSYIMRGKFWVNNHAHVVRAKHGVTTNEYLSFMLNYLNIDPFIGGDARGKLTKAVLQEIEVPHPDFTEQQRIAQVLSKVQEAIAEQERLIHTTTELKQALMQKLFTEGLRGEAQKETEIGPVPESWTMTTIGAEANVTKLAGYEYTKHVKYTDEGEIIAIRGVNLKDGKLDLTDVKRIWRRVSEELPRSQLHPGDVLLSYVGTVGSVAMVEESGKYHLAPNVAKLTPKDRNRLTPEFLLAYLRTDIGRADLFRSVSQTSQPVISMARIRSLHLPLPDVHEQTSIVATLAAADQKLDNASRKRNALQDLFRTLLHELMTGKVRLNDFDHEHN